MDNSIMIYALSEPIQYRKYLNTLMKDIKVVAYFLQGNRHEHSTYNCEDVIPARQAAESILQTMCAIHEEMCEMEYQIKEKEEFLSWRKEVGEFEKKAARD